MSSYIGYIGSAISNWWYQTPAPVQDSEPPKEECRETVCNLSKPVDAKQFENTRLALLKNRRRASDRRALIDRGSIVPTVKPQTYHDIPTLTPNKISQSCAQQPQATVSLSQIQEQLKKIEENK